MSSVTVPTYWCLAKEDRKIYCLCKSPSQSQCKKWTGHNIPVILAVILQPVSSHPCTMGSHSRLQSSGDVANRASDRCRLDELAISDPHLSAQVGWLCDRRASCQNFWPTSGQYLFSSSLLSFLCSKPLLCSTDIIPIPILQLENPS